MREIVAAALELAIRALVKAGLLPPGENLEEPYSGPVPDMVGTGKGNGLEEDK